MTSLADRIERAMPHALIGMRTGLAIVLAVGIALAMDWQRPQWAGIAVMSVSQDSGAATLGKGLLRLLATLGAAVSALTLIALFPQDRWGFFLALSLYVGLCGYHMLGSRHAYAWRVAAYVCPVIAISAGGPEGVNDFATAIERLLENVVGVLTIVSLGLMARTPDSGRSLRDNVLSLARDLADLLDRSAQSLAGGRLPESGTSAPASSLRKGLAQYEGWLQAAIDGDFRIREQRLAWRLLRRRFAELLNGIECWRLSLLQLSPSVVATGLERQRAAADALQQRLRILARQPTTPPQRLQRSVPSPTGPVAIPSPGALPARDRAALVLASEQWHRIEQTTTAVEDLLVRLRQDPRDLPQPTDALDSPWALNPDHLHVAIRLMTGIWCAALLWIFVPDLPAGAGLVTLTAVFSAVFALANVPAFKVLPLILLSLLPAGLVYVLVLPRLEGYIQLAILLFFYTVFAFLVAGKLRPARTLAVDFMLITFGISNQQTYSFVGFLDRTVAVVLACMIIALLEEVLWSSRSPSAYLQTLSRLHRAVVGMIDALGSPRSRHPIPRWLRRQQRRFLQQELARLPDRLERSSRTLTPVTIACSDTSIIRINDAARRMASWTLELERICKDPAVRDLIVQAATGPLMGSSKRPADPLQWSWGNLPERMYLIERSALRSLGERQSLQGQECEERPLQSLSAVARGLAESVESFSCAWPLEQEQPCSSGVTPSLS